ISMLRSTEPAPAPGGKETHYAEAPVLNPQQLVLTFVQPVRSHSRWERETVPVGVKDKGVYLVEAVRRDLRAYTILIASGIVLVSKAAKGRIVNFVVDRNTGEPIRDASIWGITRDSRSAAVKTDAEGMADLPIAATSKDLRIVSRNGADFGVNAFAEYS